MIPPMISFSLNLLSCKFGKTIQSHPFTVAILRPIIVAFILRLYFKKYSSE